MKPISVTTQKRIMFIPIINPINLFIFGYNCHQLRIPTKTWLKVWLYLFGYTIPAILVSEILLFIFSAFTSIISLLSMYVVPLAMSYGLIKFQEKYMHE